MCYSLWYNAPTMLPATGTSYRGTEYRINDMPPIVVELTLVGISHSAFLLN